MKREKQIMISLDMLHLKVVVVADFKVLEDLIVHHSQIFLKIFSVILEVGLQEDLVNRGNDLRYDVGISLEEAYQGTEKNVRYTTYKSKSCSGSGAAKGSKSHQMRLLRRSWKSEN